MYQFRDDGGCRGAVRHDVYLGTSATEVETATPTSPEFRGSETPATHELSDLDPQTAYYGRSTRWTRTNCSPAEGLCYNAEFSRDLVQWFSGPGHVAFTGSRQPRPDGMERVTVRFLGDADESTDVLFGKVGVATE